MKKIYWIAVMVSAIFLLGIIYFNGNYQEKEENQKESRGIFISYIEYMKYFDNKDEIGIKKEVDNIIDNVVKYHFNRIYLQVRPFSDSIYYSNIFPYSHTISGKQGKKINIDVLEYFLKKSHDNKVEVHAWINPYRISNGVDTKILSKDNPAYSWLNTNKVKVIKDKGIYYNPASKEVIDLIVSGVDEIVKNYEVDGILFDDYFYPDDTIDLEEYKQVQDTISIKDFRLSKVNELVNNVYKTIKNNNPNILFGISPDGNIENNYEINYADVKKWLLEDEYVDYIMPQIYYGFYHEVKPFIRTLNEWRDLVKNNTILIPALALYKSGLEDIYAKSGKNEWIEYSDIIKKQIQVSKNLKNYSGFTIFRYDYLLEKNDNLSNEIDNFETLFSKIDNSFVKNSI